MIKDVYELTPVQRIGNILVKRDDLFMPFDNLPLSGGKVRQSLMLLNEKRNEIITECNGKVVTIGTTQSPQGIIVAICCKEFGLDYTMVVNGDLLQRGTQKIEKHSFFRHVLNNGGKIDFGSKGHFENTLSSYIKRKYPSSYFIKFGINAANSYAILESNARQVANLPRDIENLIIPVGGGITMAGVIMGCKIYNIRPKRIIGIQISGHDWRNVIEELVPKKYKMPYEYIVTGDYANYSKRCDEKLMGELEIDPLYEAKAYSWVLHNRREVLTKDSLFWIVGNTLPIRRIDAGMPKYDISDFIISMPEYKASNINYSIKDIGHIFDIDELSAQRLF